MWSRSDVDAKMSPEETPLPTGAGSSNETRIRNLRQPKKDCYHADPDRTRKAWFYPDPTFSTFSSPPLVDALFSPPVVSSPRRSSPASCSSPAARRSGKR